MPDATVNCESTLSPVVCPKNPLTRDIDVSVSISRPIAEVATDMTMICFATPSVDFGDGGNDRVRFYSSFDALTQDVPVNSPAYWAGTAFFSRSDRPTTMCVGRIFEDDTQAVLRGGAMSAYQVNKITDGGFDIYIDGELTSVRGLDFTNVKNVADVAKVVAANVVGVSVGAENGALVIRSNTKGDGSELSYAVPPSATTYNSYTIGSVVESDIFNTLSGTSDGAIVLHYNGKPYGIADMDFTTCASLKDVFSVIELALRAAGLSGAKVNGDDDFIVFSIFDVAGAGFRPCTEAPVGTDIGKLLHLFDIDTPKTTSVGAAATEKPCSITSGQGLDFTAIKALGTTNVEIAGTSYQVNFSNVTDGQTLVTALTASTQLAAAYTPTYTNALTLNGKGNKFVYYLKDDKVGQALKLTAGTAGTIVPVAVSKYTTVKATDVSALLKLSSTTASNIVIGYSPCGITSELNNIARAARCAGRSIYGWVIDAKYRDTQEQRDVADWIEPRKPAYFSTCTNSPQAYNSADISNIGYYCYNKGYTRTSVIYHDNSQVYPDMSYIALALSVDYAQENSTLTMKFKQLTGIETSPLTESQLSVLNSRRINSYVSIGNSATTVREGVQGNSSWYTDSLVNLDNFAEELQVEVYNVFLRNKKVPYTNGGQNLLVSAAAKICRRYTQNGTFAERSVETLDNETGFTTLPATDIRPAAVYSATVSDREKRLAPPIAITCYEAGAFHKVALNIGVYS